MKETIKLVLVDIDGTLLNSKLEVSDKTLEAISKLSEKGILFGIATGRSPYAVRHLVKQWKIDQYCDLIMGFNGGSTLNYKTGELSSCYLIHGKYLKEVRETFKDFDVNFGIYDKESYHCIYNDKMAYNIATKNNLPLVIEDLSYYDDKEMEKMLMMADPATIDKAIAYYNENVHTDKYKAVRSTPTLLEFLNPVLSKSKGIEDICKNLGFEMDNVLTFGDEMNDLEMIRDCVGVAMGNAIDKIKEVSTYITLSNDEDGIADFLNKHIL